MRNLPRHIWYLPRNTIVLLLHAYQTTLSPDHGPLRHLYEYGYCRHTPTCSRYAIDAVQRRGALVGSLMTFKRVITCHPWRTPSDEKILRTLEEHFPKKP